MGYLDGDYREFKKFDLKLITFVTKILFYVFFWTGFGWFFIIMTLMYLIRELTSIDPFSIFNSVLIGDLFVIVFIFIIPTVTMVTNIIRIIIRDPQFSLLHLIFPERRSKYKFKAIKSLKSKKIQGFIFGKHGRDYICKREDIDGHALVIGGVGTGKSSCIAIPTLLSYNCPVFAIDIKGELSRNSAKYRRHTKIFNPKNLNTIGYNPYYFLNKDTRNKAQNAKDIALSIIPLKPDIKEPFWVQSAQNILTGVILYLSAKGYNFVQTMQIAQKTPVKNMVQGICKSSDKIAIMFVNQYLGLDDRVLSGIASELSNRIIPFAVDEDIINALSKDDYITPDDLDNDYDIFVTLPEDKLEQWKPLLTLICTQFLKHFERRDETTDLTPILFMLDEFPRLGKMEPILNGLATLRSKQIMIALFVQSIAQLDYIYGREARKIIADTCAYKAILGATDAETQDYISKLIGTFDKLHKSNTSSYKPIIHFNMNNNATRTTQEKKILNPETLAYLQDIILLSPDGFMRVDKTPYYKHKKFLERI